MSVALRNSLYGFEMRSDDPDRRRVEEGATKSYEIKQLWQRSHEIIALAVRGMGYREIAEVLGLNEKTVTHTLNSEVGMKKLSDMRKLRDKNAVEIGEEIERLTMKAIKTYDEIFDNPSAALKLKKETADTVLLDIKGLRAPTKIDSRSMTVHATHKEIEEWKRRGIEAAKNAGLLVELPQEGLSDNDSV